MLYTFKVKKGQNQSLVRTLAIFWMAEKVTKMTSAFPYDDILIDILWFGIKKAAGKDKS